MILSGRRNMKTSRTALFGRFFVVSRQVDELVVIYPFKIATNSLFAEFS